MKRKAPKCGDVPGVIPALEKFAQAGGAAQAAVDDLLAASVGPELAASVQAELHAMAVIAETLIALKPPERARVLLMCALKTAPNALTDNQIAELLRLAKQP
jgi:hypothetical protein